MNFEMNVFYFFENDKFIHDFFLSKVAVGVYHQTLMSAGQHYLINSKYQNFDIF